MKKFGLNGYSEIEIRKKAFVISQNIRVVCHYLTFDFMCGFLKAQRVNSRF